MRNKVTQKLTFFIVAVFGICGLVACNGDDSTASKGMSSDSTTKTAATVVDSTVKDTTAMAAKPAKKKRKASIVFPSNGTDKIAKDRDGIYNRAESMPEYPGGHDALSTYINDHVDDAQPAMDDDNTTGTVRISFVIDENGKVIDVQSMGDKKTSNGLDDQAVKVIKDMPAWTPGKVKGKNVKTRLELPITFEVGS
jgi:protein TonB